MSLSYDTTKCNPPTPTDDNDAAVREGLIWATMFVGINDITEASAGEFYARIHALEKMGGAILNASVDGGGFEPRPITRDDVKRWTGLKTNASLKTRAQFMKTLGTYLDDFAKGTRD